MRKLMIIGFSLMFTGLLTGLTAITLVAFGVTIAPDAMKGPGLLLAWGFVVFLFSAFVGLIGDD